MTVYRLSKALVLLFFLVLAFCFWDVRLDEICSKDFAGRGFGRGAGTGGDSAMMI